MADADLQAREEERALEPDSGYKVGTFHVKTGGQSVGDVAEEVFGSNTEENRHHLWDWNRNQIATPESIIPGGTNIRIVEPGKASGGPPVHALANAKLTTEDMRRSSTVAGDGKTTEEEDAKRNVPAANRAVTRDMTPGRVDNTKGIAKADTHVPEGSSGSVAQREQDRREAEGNEPKDASGAKPGEQPGSGDRTTDPRASLASQPQAGQKAGGAPRTGAPAGAAAGDDGHKPPEATAVTGKDAEAAAKAQEGDFRA